MEESRTTYTPADLTFAVCAYGESPYLRSCIRSLLAQSVKCPIIVVTSTPNAHISRLAEQYRLPLYVSSTAAEKSAAPTEAAKTAVATAEQSALSPGTGIATDWNHAYASAKTALVTLAHQDDIYHKTYAETVLSYLNKSSRPLIAFTDYSELRGNVREVRNRMLVIKRILLSPLLIKPFWSSRFIRRRILSFGSPICCPSVTYVKGNLPDPVFTEGYRSNLDWQAWERLSSMQGQFVFCPRNLMSHRIHKDSATTAIIADADRSKEDLEMFGKFWPAPVAKCIEHFYRDSERLNRSF